MATYAPTILNFPEGIVTVESTTGTSYEQIVNSMGSTLYQVNQMYENATTNNQLLIPIKFNSYNVNGEIENYNQVVVIDPYQYQASSFFSMENQGVVLNGRTSLNTTVLGNENLNLILYTCEASNSMLLKGETIFDDYFFKDFNDVL